MAYDQEAQLESLIGQLQDKCHEEKNQQNRNDLQKRINNLEEIRDELYIQQLDIFNEELKKNEFQIQQETEQLVCVIQTSDDITEIIQYIDIYVTKLSSLLSLIVKN